MAIIAVECPNCKGKPELDDGKEFAFCPYCGTIIKLHERVLLTPDGSLDDLRKAGNKFTIGNREFDSRNYDKAYDYFTKGLEDDPFDIEAVYRKGICAVYLSQRNLENLKIDELKTALTAARKIVLTPRYDEKRLSEIATQKGKDLCELLDFFEGKSNTYQERLPNKEKCQRQSARWCELAKLYHTAVPELVSPKELERVLLNGINLCDDVMRRPVEYFVSSEYNSRTKKSEERYSYYRMDSGREKLIRNIRSDLAVQYNNLPSRIEQEQQLNRSLEELRGQKEELEAAKNQAKNQYEAAKATFWENNPELREQRDKKKKLSWISVGIGAILLLAGVLLRKKGVVPPTAGALSFGSSFYIRSIVVKRLIGKMERELFPPDVKEAGGAFDAAMGRYIDKSNEYARKQKEVDSFIRSKK